MGSTASIVWKDAYESVAPLINAEGLLCRSFDPLLPVDVRFYSYDRRRDFRLCRHDYFEVFYLYSGALRFRVNDRLFAMKSGDLILLNSTQYHKIHQASRRRNAAIQGVLLYFLPEVLRSPEASGEGSEYLSPFLQQDNEFPHVIPAEATVPHEVYSLIQMISSELPALTWRARLAIRTYLKMILVKFVNHYAAYVTSDHLFNARKGSIERLRPLFDFLDHHYDEHTSLEQASRLVHMSTSHFRHFFKQVTGLSFISYLNQFRISKAQELLATTDKSIAEIAQQVGFFDQSYFGQAFRKLLTLTPGQFRIQARSSSNLRTPLASDENETESPSLAISQQSLTRMP